MYGRAGSSGDTEETTPKPVPQTPIAQTRNAPAPATHSDRRNTTTRNHPRAEDHRAVTGPQNTTQQHQNTSRRLHPRHLGHHPLPHHQHTATRQRLAQRPRHRRHTPQQSTRP